MPDDTVVCHASLLIGNRNAAPPNHECVLALEHMGPHQCWCGMVFDDRREVHWHIPPETHP